jgi:hypothetical protein
MLRSARLAVALASVLAATHPVFADMRTATASDQVAAPATEQPASQTPSWSSSLLPGAPVPASAGLGKGMVAVGFGWG